MYFTSLPSHIEKSFKGHVGQLDKSCIQKTGLGEGLFKALKTGVTNSSFLAIREASFK